MDQVCCVPSRSVTTLRVRAEWIHDPTACQYLVSTNCSALDLLPLLYLLPTLQIHQVTEYLYQKNTDSFRFVV